MIYQQYSWTPNRTNVEKKKIEGKMISTLSPNTSVVSRCVIIWQLANPGQQVNQFGGSRIIISAGYGYGNSLSMPFIKKFYWRHQ